MLTLPDRNVLSCSAEVPITLDIFRAGSPPDGAPIESIELFEESECCLCLLRELSLLLAELVALAPIHIFKGCITLFPPGGAILEKNKKNIFG